MARPKKVKVSEGKLEEVKETLPVEQPVEKPIEQPVEVPQVAPVPVVVPTEESEAKKQFRALIEQYRRVSRPEKFARKEPELLAKLNRL